MMNPDILSRLKQEEEPYVQVPQESEERAYTYSYIDHERIKPGISSRIKQEEVMNAQDPQESGKREVTHSYIGHERINPETLSRIKQEEEPYIQCSQGSGARNVTHSYTGHEMIDSNILSWIKQEDGSWVLAGASTANHEARQEVKRGEKPGERATECFPVEAKKRTLLNGEFIFKDRQTVICKYCKGEYKYHRSTSSLSYHLRTKHAFSSTQQQSKDSSRHQPILQLQEKIQTNPADPNKNKSITNAIARWIAMDAHPVNIVSDDGLQEVLRIATGCQNYELPTRPEIDACMRDLFELEKSKIQALVDGVAHIALTVDYWTSLANDSYLGVTCHMLDQTWTLHSCPLTVCHVEERHFTSGCTEHFSRVAKEWRIYDKVTTISTDNTHNVTAVAGLLPFEHIPCFAHILQLSVNKAMGKCGIEVIMAKCRKIVSHFKHSPVNQVELQDQQQKLNMKIEMLVQDVSTRWNSTLDMIQRLVWNKEAVIATLTHPQHKHTLSLLTVSEWDQLYVMQTILEPCKHAMKLLGGDRYIPCSVILPTICHLYHTMMVSDEDPAYVVHFKEEFSADLKVQQLNWSWLNIATALDPRFKLLKCMPKEQRGNVWKELRSLVARGGTEAGIETTSTEPSKKKVRLYAEYSSDSDDDPLLQPTAGNMAVDRYIAEPQIDQELCPLQWWKTHEVSHPVIARLAMKYLGTPATTVPCEHLFSISGHIVNKKRAALSPATVENLVCLSGWLKQ